MTEANTSGREHRVLKHCFVKTHVFVREDWFRRCKADETDPSVCFGSAQIGGDMGWFTILSDLSWYEWPSTGRKQYCEFGNIYIAKGKIESDDCATNRVLAFESVSTPVAVEMVKLLMYLIEGRVHTRRVYDVELAHWLRNKTMSVKEFNERTL